ncbi:hypothetical protein LEMLEM_LOCUS16329 [Lemmus lemmus]
MTSVEMSQRMKPAWKGHAERNRRTCRMQLCASEGDRNASKLCLLVQLGSLSMLRNVLGNGELARLAT